MKKIWAILWALVVLAISGIALGYWAMHANNQPTVPLNLLWTLVSINICCIALCCWMVHDFISWILIALALGGIALCGEAINDFSLWAFVALAICGIALGCWALIRHAKTLNSGKAKR